MDNEETVSISVRLGALAEERDSPLTLGAWLFSGLGGTESNERVLGIEIHRSSTGPGAPGRFSRENLAKYTELLATKQFETFRTVALKLLNRLDFSGTFRMLEREVVFQRAVLEAIRFLDEQRPMLLVFPVTPHLFLPYVAANVANFLKIPVIYFQPCPVAPVVFPHILTDWHAQSLRPGMKSELRAELLESAREELATLRFSRDPTYMRLQKNNDESAALPRRRATAILRTIESILRPASGAAEDFFSHQLPNPLFRRVLQILLVRLLKRQLQRASDLLPEINSVTSDYSIFALHYEPERTSLPDGLPIVFQADAVAIARSIVPPEQKLVVKEHYSQTSSSLRGFQGRSPLVYGLLQSYAGLDFVSSRERLSSLLNRANCVFTLTGTIAIESVLKGVPVAYFGSPWWSGMPGTIRVSPGICFREVISTPVPDSNVIEEFLIDLIQKNSIPGLGGENRDSVQRRLGSLGPYFEVEESVALLDLIVETIHNNRF